MKQLIKEESGVRLWRVESPSGDMEEDAFLVDDPQRTLEDWRFWKKNEAEEKFHERVKAATRENK